MADKYHGLLFRSSVGVDDAFAVSENVLSTSIYFFNEVHRMLQSRVFADKRCSSTHRPARKPCCSSGCSASSICSNLPRRRYANVLYNNRTFAIGRWNGTIFLTIRLFGGQHFTSAAEIKPWLKIVCKQHWDLFCCVGGAMLIFLVSFQVYLVTWFGRCRGMKSFITGTDKCNFLLLGMV